MKKTLLIGFTALFIYVSKASASVLADYVAEPDSSYSYYVKQLKNSNEDLLYAEIILTSQTWHENVWKHQLYIIKPKTVRPDSRHALLLIDGGRWTKSVERAGENGKTPKFETALNNYAYLANKMQTVVAILRHVPYQPLWGLREDRLIAHTFDQYLKTGVADWPLLLPMVKSVVRGMDTVQNFSRKEWGLEINTFTLTGASKRGWTTWLTGAIDQRVTAIAPMVIDMLNMGPQMRHQEAVFGEGRHSEKISDYTNLDLHKKTETDAGNALQSIVDPYRYRANLTLPKLIILGTNDRYWTLDALSLYWKGLQGEKYILYMPNEGHGLRDYQKIIGSVNALHQRAAFGARLPKLDWEAVPSGRKLVFRAKSDILPKKVLAWVAYSPTRDFREAVWSSAATHKRKNGNEFVYRLDIPNDKCAAVFLETEYDAKTPYYFSTNVQIVGPNGCEVQ